MGDQPIKSLAAKQKILLSGQKCGESPRKFKLKCSNYTWNSEGRKAASFPFFFQIIVLLFNEWVLTFNEGINFCRNVIAMLPLASKIKLTHVLRLPKPIKQKQEKRGKNKQDF